jgi:hypothetical protein
MKTFLVNALESEKMVDNKCEAVHQWLTCGLKSILPSYAIMDDASGTMFPLDH